jgi:hypothetical protein
MDDRGDYPTTEALEAVTRISKLPENQRGPELKKFLETHPGDHPRVILGRARDGGSVLQLKDAEGHDRLVLRVAPDGTPKLQFLDAAGKVLSELPQNTASLRKSPITSAGGHTCQNYRTSVDESQLTDRRPKQSALHSPAI